MAIPTRAVLRAELHCLSHNGLWVITAQHWYDASAPAGQPRSWLRLVRNGRVEQDLEFTGEQQHAELEQFWTERSASFAPTALTEDQMWVELRERAGIEQTWCQRKDCNGGLPVGRTVCPECHRDVRRVAHGSMVAAHRRGDIQMPPVWRPETR